MKYDHTVSGSRIIDSPCARTLNTVATMFRPLIVKDAMKSAMLSSQIVCPFCDPGTAAAIALSGGYAVHPAAAAPPVTKNEARSTSADSSADPVRQHVQERKRHVPGADLERHEVVAESADQHVRDEEEHHDGAVHRHDGEVELRRHDAAHVAARQQPRRAASTGARAIRAEVGSAPASAPPTSAISQPGDDVLDADDSCDPVLNT